MIRTDISKTFACPLTFNNHEFPKPSRTRKMYLDLLFSDSSGRSKISHFDVVTAKNREKSILCVQEEVTKV